MVAASPPPPNFEVRPIALEDAAVWERLRCALWPDGVEDHHVETAAFFQGNLVEPIAVLVAVECGEIAGFAELSIRFDVPSWIDQPVGYIEGLYVIPEARFRGIARLLLASSRSWARGCGCAAVASDRAGRYVLDRRYERPADAATCGEEFA